MAEFHFIRPAFLLFLLPIVWILWRRPGQKGWSDILPGHLAQVLVTDQGVKKSLGIPVLIWVLMTVALAGPTWQKIQLPVYQLNQGAIVIADMTLSMYATDVKPDRLTRARYKIIDLLGEITDGDVGLVAYSGDAFVISPLTPDRNNIVQLLPALAPEIMPSIGSNPVAAFELAGQLLIDSGHNTGDIYWITDGIHNQNESAVKNWIAKSNYRVSALVIGTEAGAPIRLPNGELLKDTEGNIIVPTIDMASMKRAVKIGQLRQQTSDNADVKSLASDLVSDRKQSEAQREGDQWQDVGPYLVLIILPLFVWFFRRGGLFFVLTLVLLQPEKQLYADSHETPISSSNQTGFSWSSLFSNQNQKASQLFESKNFDEAANTFSDPLWQASSSYKAGNYEKALELYQAQAANKDDADLQFNMGNTLARLGQLDDAIKAYDQAIKLQPDHADALANKALLEQLKSEQQEQQSQDQSQNGQDQQQNGENDSESQSGQQSDQPSDQQSSEDNKPSSDSSSEPNQDSSASNPESESDNEKDDAQSAIEESEKDSNSETDTSSAQASSVESPFDDLTPEEQQRMNQLLNQVTDDPSLLLRNKMLLNYQSRQQQGQNLEDTITW